MIRYIQRTLTGDITGDYANPQPGYAEEQMDDSALEYVAYRQRINTPPPKEPDAKAILRALVKKGLLTTADAQAEIGK